MSERIMTLKVGEEFGGQVIEHRKKRPRNTKQIYSVLIGAMQITTMTKKELVKLSFSRFTNHRESFPY